MQMPGRSFSSNAYRYGFNGMEKDDEIKGEGNSINYKYRMHDPRLGRFFAVDPLAPEYAYNSPYAFSENRVIDGIELEGLEVVLVGGLAKISGGLSYAEESGVLIAPDGIYAYGSTALGVETNVSLSFELSITIYPTMPSAKYAQGSGTSTGASVTAGFVANGTASVNHVESSGYTGINTTFGVELGLPGIIGAASTYSSNTTLTPLSSLAKNSKLRESALNHLTDARSQLNNVYDDLATKYNGVIKASELYRNQARNINNSLQSATGGNEMQLLTELQSTLGKINAATNIAKDLNKQIDGVKGQIQQVDGAIEQLTK